MSTGVPAEAGTPVLGDGPILEGHASSQASITSALQAFQGCAEAAVDEQAAIDNLRDQADNKSAEHIACRIAEANNTAGVRVCETGEARLKLAKDYVTSYGDIRCLEMPASSIHIIYIYKINIQKRKVQINKDGFYI